MSDIDVDTALGAYLMDVMNAHPHLSTRFKIRTKARRAVLIAAHGGKCSGLGCDKVVENYENPGIWEFDHIYDRHKCKESPVTGIKQFPISGSDCARRKWSTVVEHCLYDTRLLCYECHDRKNKKYWTPTYSTLAKDMVHKAYKDIFGTAPTFIAWDD
jgi:hypothetical protein